MVGGESLAVGYLGDDKAARFLELEIDGRRNRFFRTGDRAKRDAEGILHFLGRTDNQVKISGVRVELEELENLLLSYPGVGASCVAAIKGGEGNKLLAVLMV